MPEVRALLLASWPSGRPALSARTAAYSDNMSWRAQVLSSAQLLVEGGEGYGLPRKAPLEAITSLYQYAESLSILFCVG